MSHSDGVVARNGRLFALPAIITAFRERAAQPIITLNYSERIPDHRTPLSGLYLANTSQIYPEDRGTNYSVRLGNQIAEMVKNDLTNDDPSASHPTSAS